MDSTLFSTITYKVNPFFIANNTSSYFIFFFCANTYRACHWTGNKSVFNKKACNSLLNP